MMIFRVHKTKNYTVMANHHLQNRELSLRARGLLSIILSLPDDWNYSKAGLLKIVNESEFILNNTLDELKEHRYLEIEKHKPTNGSNRYTYTYNVYEIPRQDPNFQGVENQALENQALENQGVENLGLYKRRNLSNTNKLNTNEPNTDKRKRFTPPTLDDIKAYCQERHNNVDAQKFYDYYTEGNWHDAKGNPVKNWKQKLLTWERKDNTSAKPNPSKIMDEREYKDEDFSTGYYADIMNRPRMGK